MRDLLEIYTPSKTFDDVSEIKEIIDRCRTEIDMWSFEEIARYYVETDSEKTILVEMQVSTKHIRDIGCDDFIDVVAYVYNGKIEDCMADSEIYSKQFKERYDVDNWRYAIDEMKHVGNYFAEQILKQEEK